MRFNRWLRKGPAQDIKRMCANRPESAALIDMLATWAIDQLAEDPHLKGETRTSPDGKITYKRWVVGPITVIFRLLPEADQTVVIEGFVPTR
jgi:hypothetical protein